MDKIDDERSFNTCVQKEKTQRIRTHNSERKINKKERRYDKQKKKKKK